MAVGLVGIVMGPAVTQIGWVEVVVVVPGGSVMHCGCVVVIGGAVTHIGKVEVVVVVPI